MPTIMRCILTLTISWCLSVVAMSHALDAYQNKNRLILFSVVDAASAKNFTATLEKFRADLEERDVKIIDLSAQPTKIAHTLRLSDEQVASLRKQYRLAGEQAQTVFILIGKDGGEKARQSKRLDLAPWFALIDQMPMRRREMEEKRKSALRDLDAYSWQVED